MFSEAPAVPQLPTLKTSAELHSTNIFIFHSGWKVVDKPKGYA